MREDFPGQYKFDTVEEEPEASSPLAVWIWPVLGTLAIAVIVVTVLQYPWILTKLGLQTDTPIAIATKPITPPASQPVEQTNKTTPEEKTNTPETAKIPIHDIADMQIKISQIADTLKAISISMKKQDSRLARLEGIVGTVTGSTPRPEGKAASSAQSKTVKVKPENQVNAAQKADLLTIAAPAKKRIGSETAAPPVSSTTAHQDTGDARAKPATAKSAALNTTNISRFTKPKEQKTQKAPKEQYAVKLARARSISRLAIEWERLIRGKAGELSVLNPRIVPLTTKKGNKVFDLIAGPFNHMADAIELCARLKLEGMKCKQAKYGGKPL